MKRRKKYDSPVVLQQAEILLELAFLEQSNTQNGFNNGGIFSDTQDLGKDLNDEDDVFDGWY